MGGRRSLEGQRSTGTQQGTKLLYFLVKKMSGQNTGIGSGLIHMFCYGLPRYILINFGQLKMNVNRCDLHEAPPGEDPSSNRVIRST